MYEKKVLKRDKVKAAWKPGITLKELSEIVGCTQNCVRIALKRFNLTYRKPKIVRKKKVVDMEALRIKKAEYRKRYYAAHKEEILAREFARRDERNARKRELRRQRKLQGTQKRIELAEEIARLKARMKQHIIER